MYVGITA